MKRIWFAAAILLLVLGCSEANNPLLGKWKIDEKASPEGVGASLSAAGADVIEFQEGRIVIGSNSYAVEYAVEGKTVSVKSGQNDKGTFYKIRSNDQISSETSSGDFVYNRIE